MLVLSRKVSEKIQIGEEITVTVVRLSNGGVRLGIEAPDGVPILRDDVGKRTGEVNASRSVAFQKTV